MKIGLRVNKAIKDSFVCVDDATFEIGIGGGQIASALTTYEPNLSNHHSNFVLEGAEMKDRYSEVIDNIKKYGNKNSCYIPTDKSVSYALTSQDFVRTGFYKEYAPTLSARDYKDPKIVIEGNNMIKIKQVTKEGFIEMEEGGVFDASYPKSNTRRGRCQENGTVSPTLTAQNNELYRIENQYRIRKLTPLECFRLMGVTDSDGAKMLSVNSNSQCYKQAGNSIVVDVMVAMFKQLFN